MLNLAKYNNVASANQGKYLGVTGIKVSSPGEVLSQVEKSIDIL
jgi:hypothetical protein